MSEKQKFFPIFAQNYLIYYDKYNSKVSTMWQHLIKESINEGNTTDEEEE